MSDDRTKTRVEIEMQYDQLCKKARNTPENQRKELLDRESPLLASDIYHSVDLGQANRIQLAKDVKKHLYDLLKHRPPESPLFQELVQHASRNIAVDQRDMLGQHTNNSQRHDM